MNHQNAELQRAFSSQNFCPQVWNINQNTALSILVGSYGWKRIHCLLEKTMRGLCPVRYLHRGLHFESKLCGKDQIFPP